VVDLNLPNYHVLRIWCYGLLCGSWRWQRDWGTMSGPCMMESWTEGHVHRLWPIATGRRVLFETLKQQTADKNSGFDPDVPR